MEKLKKEKEREKPISVAPRFAHAPSGSWACPCPRRTRARVPRPVLLRDSVTCHLFKSIPVSSLQLNHILTKLKLAIFSNEKTYKTVSGPTRNSKWTFVSPQCPQKHPHFGDVSPLQWTEQGDLFNWDKNPV